MPSPFSVKTGDISLCKRETLAQSTSPLKIPTHGFLDHALSSLDFLRKLQFSWFTPDRTRAKPPCALVLPREPNPRQIWYKPREWRHLVLIKCFIEASECNWHYTILVPSAQARLRILKEEEYRIESTRQNLPLKILPYLHELGSFSVFF
jgi:hypothetical protein